MTKTFFVYMMASRRNGTLYIGVTSDLPGRTYTHRENLVDGFTRRYGVHRLVWYEWIDDAHAAIAREKQLKEVEPGMEDPADRGDQPPLGRPLPIAICSVTLQSRDNVLPRQPNG